MAITTAEPEVCSIVDSIVSSFQNGMEIFRRLRRRRSKKQSQPSLSEEEDRLRESLTYRPLEISQQYDTDVTKLGRRYEVGDCISQTRLAHTLLVLNTGLIKLLNHALSDDSKQRSMSRKNLLCLSEVAATDTLTALSELRMRLIGASQLALHTPLHDIRQDGRITKKRDLQSLLRTEMTALSTRIRPPPTPLLARGGWVRSKSGTSVVSVPVSPNSKSNEHRRGQHARSKSMPVPFEDRSKAYDDDFRSSEQMPTIVSRCVHHEPQHRAWDSSQPRNVSNCSTEKNIQERPPSIVVIPADLFETYSRSQLYQAKQPQMYEDEIFNAPPRPPKIPLHSRPNIHTRPRASTGPAFRPRPLSTATFLTTSTKIGEIPEEKLPDRVLSEEEQARIPLPYTIPPPLEPPRRKGRGFKFWKRPQMDERSGLTAICH